MAAELLEAMERLQVVESPSLPILSLYLNLAPERIERRSIGARLRDLLEPIEKLATSGELDHDSSMSLRSGIGRILGFELDLAGSLGQGVAIFLCDGIGLDERLTMPRRVWDCAIAGPKPYLRPLQAMLDEYRKLAAVVLDGRDAEITVFHLGSVVGAELIEGELLRKSDLAGWHGLEERRHRKHAEEARHKLFREVAQKLNRLHRDSGVDLVFIGGLAELTRALLPFLDERLRGITETFVVDVNTITQESLTARVAALEEAFERREEAAEVTAVYEAAAEGDMAVVGMERVLRAVNRSAVARLLVHDAALADGSICDDCGALSLPTSTCRECGGVTEKVPELLEAMARSVVDAGGSVEHVMTQTGLAGDLVAARLRFIPW